jgi:hypothetical protein
MRRFSYAFSSDASIVAGTPVYRVFSIDVKDRTDRVELGTVWKNRGHWVASDGKTTTYNIPTRADAADVLSKAHAKSS